MPTSLLTKLYCVVYWLFAILMAFLAVSALLGKFDTEALEEAKWAGIFGVLGLCLGLSGVGLWTGKRWGVVLSAALMAGFVVYSIWGDFGDADLWGVLIKALILAPAIAVLHVYLWRRGRSEQAFSG